MVDLRIDEEAQFVLVHHCKRGTEFVGFINFLLSVDQSPTALFLDLFHFFLENQNISARVRK